MFMEKGATPIDRELNKKVVKIIHGLLMMQESAAFRKPVPHKALGLEDYKMIVKKPTDLNLIRRQNNEGKYKFVEEVLDDIQLCWDNCKLYNAIGSEIYNQALFLQENFDKLGIQVLPDFWEGINRQQYNRQFNQRKLEQDKKKPEIRTSQYKNETPVLMKEDSSRQKFKKKVTFQSKGAEQSEYMHSEMVQHVSYSKEKQENIEHEQADSHIPSAHHIDKHSMDVEEGEDHPSATVQPISVNLFMSPSKEQLSELSQYVKKLYEKEDFSMLQKVVQILHTNEKQNMSLSKNGQMSFKMNKIHISTYYRLKKVLGLAEETTSIIE